MANIAISYLVDDVNARLPTRAAGPGRSSEEEARLITGQAKERDAAPKFLMLSVHKRLGGLRGHEPWVGRQECCQNLKWNSKKALFEIDVSVHRLR